MDNETKIFKENIDAWVKQIRSEFSELQDATNLICEAVENTQHNYELIHILKEEIDDLKKEINALKLIQIISLRDRVGKNCCLEQKI